MAGRLATIAFPATDSQCIGTGTEIWTERDGSMTLLIIGLCLFVGIHVVPAVPALRTDLAARLGERNYKVLFSVVSAVGLVAMILGYREAPSDQIFTPSDTARSVLPVAMAVAFVLMVASHLPSHIRRLLRHPMLTGVLIWAGLHFLANGDLASNILFGVLALWAVFAVISAERRGKRPGPARPGLRADAIAVVVGLTAFALVLYFHADLFGVAPL